MGREILKYRAYDDTIFDNIHEGYRYDAAALSKFSNDLWFIKLNEVVEGFNDINAQNFSSCLESFLHPKDIPTLFEYFIICPIVYCATEEAARFYSLMLRNASKNLEVKGIKVGLNYWFSDTDEEAQYRQESFFIDKFSGKGLKDFTKLKRQIITFITENI